jgi:hypothetical protein
MAGVSASRDDARDDAGADRLVALANGEARLLLDRDLAGLGEVLRLGRSAISLDWRSTILIFDYSCYSGE